MKFSKINKKNVKNTKNVGDGCQSFQEGYQEEESPFPFLRDHSLIAYAKFSEKVTLLTPFYVHVRVCIRE